MARKIPLPPISTRAEAYAKGSTFYYDGKPCRAGHLSARYVSTAGCLECLNQYKGAARKHPTDSALVPYAPQNVWRPKYWDAATLDAFHVVVQQLAEDFEAQRVKNGARPPPAAPSKFRKVYGERYYSGSTVQDAGGTVHDLWFPMKPGARAQVSARVSGGDPFELFAPEALQDAGWIYLAGRWYVCRDINYELYPVIEEAHLTDASILFDPDGSR